jgi:aminoglycoside 6'-N-acetyltransferase I
MNTMAVEIKLLSPDDADILRHVAPGTFDDALDARVTQEFLSDARHHLAVAIDDGLVVGFISAVHYVHPDKERPELWINEVQVAPTHRARGLGRAILEKILEIGRELGCTEAWVLTDADNVAAKRLYSSSGGVEGAHDEVMFTFPLGTDAERLNGGSEGKKS